MLNYLNVCPLQISKELLSVKKINTKRQLNRLRIDVKSDGHPRIDWRYDEVVSVKSNDEYWSKVIDFCKLYNTKKISIAIPDYFYATIPYKITRFIYSKLKWINIHITTYNHIPNNVEILLVLGFPHFYREAKKYDLRNELVDSNEEFLQNIDKLFSFLPSEKLIFLKYKNEIINEESCYIWYYLLRTKEMLIEDYNWFLEYDSKASSSTDDAIINNNYQNYLDEKESNKILSSIDFNNENFPFEEIEINSDENSINSYYQDSIYPFVWDQNDDNILYDEENII